MDGGALSLIPVEELRGKAFFVTAAGIKGVEPHVGPTGVLLPTVRKGGPTLSTQRGGIVPVGGAPCYRLPDCPEEPILIGFSLVNFLDPWIHLEKEIRWVRNG